MRVTKEMVIAAAADLADAEGMSGVSLTAVAGRLALRTPSLYNHIDSLEQLLREVAHDGMRRMNAAMADAAVGLSGDETVKAAGAAYMTFVAAHPGVYEVIQWVGWHGDAETARIFSAYTLLLNRLLRSCAVPAEACGEVTTLLCALLHGYASLQLGNALRAPQQVTAGLVDALDTLLAGVHQKYA